MTLPVYIVDAFTEKLFGGNPAAVCPLETWMDDHLMQSLAAENNLSETAFFVKEDGHYHIRWFTPSTEVALCGHATLAAAYVLFNILEYPQDVIIFNCLSGMLKVRRTAKGKIQLDFPANVPELLHEIPYGLFEGLGIEKATVYGTPFDYMAILPSQKDIENLKPDFKTLAKTGGRGVIATAKGTDSDFVSRCFYPQSGIDEDPVTGSAHTIMVPYWAEQLGKTKLSAIQLSRRRGYLDCELQGERVLMSGDAVLYLSGEYSV